MQMGEQKMPPVMERKLIQINHQWLCSQCGEPFFEEREVRTIQRLLSQIDKQAANLASVA